MNIYESYQTSIAPKKNETIDEGSMKGLGNVDGDIYKKFVNDLYEQRNTIVPKKIEDYLNKQFKGKIVNYAIGAPGGKGQNAKILGFTVKYDAPDRKTMLPSNIDYTIIMKTDKSSVRVLARDWEDSIEIVD